VSERRRKKKKKKKRRRRKRKKNIRKVFESIESIEEEKWRRFEFEKRTIRLQTS